MFVKRRKENSHIGKNWVETLLTMGQLWWNYGWLLFFTLIVSNFSIIKQLKLWIKNCITSKQPWPQNKMALKGISPFGCNTSHVCTFCFRNSLMTLYPLATRMETWLPWRRTRGSLRSSSCLGRKPPRAPQLEESPEPKQSERRELNKIESNSAIEKNQQWKNWGFFWKN